MQIKRTTLALALAAAIGCGSASAAEPARDSATTAATKATQDATRELERARTELRQAEAQMRESARKVAELSQKLGAEDGRHAYAYRYFTSPKRAMIGIVIGDDVQGAYIAGVTPGAPAARAGVKAGDKLIAVNGKTVPAGADGDGKLARAVKGEGATEAARAMIGGLESGQHVKLTVERQGKRMDFDLAAEERESRDMPYWVGDVEPGDFDVHVDVDPVQIQKDVQVIVDKTLPEVHAKLMAGEHLKHLDAIGPAMNELFFLSDGNFSNLRMGSLNPDLGRYFGADSGVLVLENKGKRITELKGGDVIVSVGGKRVSTPSEVMRELRSGTPGASVNVEILRDKKRQVVAVDVPEHGPLLLPMPPAPPTPPEPPTPPPSPKAAPPTPPAPPSAPTPPTPPPRARAATPPPPPPPGETVAFEAQVI